MPDIIQNIAVGGGEEAVREFDKFGEAGTKAFEKVAAAAQAAAGVMKAASAQIDKALDIDTGTLNTRIKKAQKIFTDFGSSVGSFGSAAVSTGKTIAKLGVGFTAAAVGAATFVQRITKASRDTNSFKEEQAAVIGVQKQADQQARLSAIQHEQSIADVNEAFGKGKLSLEQYTEALDELNTKRRKQIEFDAKRTAIAEDEAREAARAKVALQSKEAFRQLSDTVGTQTANAFVKLGNTLDQLKNRLIQAVGPQAAELLNNLSDLISRNADKIVEVIGNIVRSLSNAFSGESLKRGQEAMDGIAAVLKAIATIVTEVIIPAFEGLIKVLDVVAKGINAVFGTNISGTAIAAGAAIATLAGGFTGLGKALAVVGPALRVLALGFSFLLANPWVIIIAAIVAALVALAVALSKVDWKSAIDKAAELWQGFLDFLKSIPEKIVKFFSDMWTGIVAIWDAGIKKIGELWGGIVTFVQGVPEAVLEVLRGMWESISQLWNDSVKVVGELWGKLVNGVSDIGSRVLDIFKGMWDNVTKLWNDATSFLGNLWAEFTSFVVGKVQEVIDKVKELIEWLKKLNPFSGSGAANAADQPAAVTASGGGHVRGPGGPTGDRIPAWLSDNEFVIKARAVRKVGLGVLHAINAGRIPRHVRGFAEGGLVTPFRVPSFTEGLRTPAENTTIGARRTFNLVIDNQRFGGLTGPDETIDNLERYAVKRRIASAGKRPGWKGQR